MTGRGQKGVTRDGETVIKREKRNHRGREWGVGAATQGWGERGACHRRTREPVRTTERTREPKVSQETRIGKPGEDHSQWPMGAGCRKTTGPSVRYWGEKPESQKPRLELEVGSLD